MLFRIFKFIFIPQINWTVSRISRPVGKLLPERFQFPVIRFFKLKYNSKSSIIVEGHYTSFITRTLFWKGVKGFEFDSIKIFTELIKTAKVFFDIGANFGYYSLLAAKQNSQIKVIAFEPFTDAAEAFKRNIQKNKFVNIKIEMLALSDNEGRSMLYFSASKEFPNYPFQLAGDNSLVDLNQVNKKSIEIETTTLDRYVENIELDSLDFIKIDTETTEYLILENGRRTIKKHRPVILCEVLKGYHEDELEAIFNELDYTYFAVIKGGLKECTSIQNNIEHKNDYYLVPSEKTQLMEKFKVK